MGRMIKLTTTENQARLIMNALELYMRVGMGQLDRIKEHPTIQKYIWDNHTDEYHNFADTEILVLRNKLFGVSYGLNGNHGINSNKIDNSNRIAFDIMQVIRHNFWKENPNRSTITVDSSIHFTSHDNYSPLIKCETVPETVQTKISFEDAPVGARFKYPGSDKIWVKINSFPKGPDHDGNGLICSWNGNVEGEQKFCSFVDEEHGIDFNTLIELV